MKKLIIALAMISLVVGCASMGEVKNRINEKPTINVKTMNATEGNYKLQLPGGKYSEMAKLVGDIIKSDWPVDKVSNNDDKADLQIHVFSGGYVSSKVNSSPGLLMQSMVLDIQIRDAKNDKWLIMRPRRLAVIDLPDGTKLTDLESPEWINKFKEEATKGVKAWVAEVKAAQ